MTFFNRLLSIYTFTRIIQNPIISHPYQDLGLPDGLNLVYLFITKKASHYLVVLHFLDNEGDFTSFHLTLDHEDFFCSVIGAFFYCLLAFYSFIDPECYG